MIFYTSDEHYFHFNIIRYTNRPFKTVEEMNKTLIENHNSVVKDGDIVRHMGDFCFGNEDNVRKIMKQLNGRHELIIGNHCNLPWEKYIETGFETVQRYKYINISGVGPVGLAHDPSCCIVCPTIPWLVGHLHQQFVRMGNAINVGVDVRNFRPVSEEVLMEDFRITKMHMKIDPFVKKEILGDESHG